MNQKWDKISSGIILVLSIVWFFVEKSTGFFTNIGFSEINPVIPFISVFSVFCMVWSFIWDSKLRNLYDKINKFEKDFVDESFSERETLKELVIARLSQPKPIESRILFEHETHLENFLSLTPNSSEYAQIYVITNDAGVENEDFGDAICVNIINNHQYVYITPFEESVFMEKLHDTLFHTKPDNIDKFLLESAIEKNIRHIQNKQFFDLLPEYSDIVIYKQQHIIPYKNNYAIYGYYSFQNGAIKNYDVSCYYYTQMETVLAKKIVENIEILLSKEEKINLSVCNYISKKVEIESGYLVCKEPISEGEVIFKKGGRFIKKENLSPDLFSPTKYIQVSADYVISSTTVHEDKELGFPIKHDCRHANCRFASPSPIKIIAAKPINEKEKILIDYAYFDPEYAEFDCKQCDVASCTRKGCTKKDIVTQLQASSALERLSPYLQEIISGG